MDESALESIEENSSVIDTKLIVSELINLLAEESSNRDVGIILEIIKTVHALVHEGGTRRRGIVSHSQVRRMQQTFVCRSCRPITVVPDRDVCSSST